MAKRLKTAGALLAALAVGTGAFGAHALKEMLENAGRTDTYETAVLYHFIHAIALIITGVMMDSNTSKWLNRAGWMFGLGIVFFSGSLYVLCFSGLGILGAVTPVGGVLFIAGWCFMALAAYTEETKSL